VFLGKIEGERTKLPFSRLKAFNLDWNRPFTPPPPSQLLTSFLPLGNVAKRRPFWMPIAKCPVGCQVHLEQAFRPNYCTRRAAALIGAFTQSGKGNRDLLLAAAAAAASHYDRSRNVIVKRYAIQTASVGMGQGMICRYRKNGRAGGRAGDTDSRRNRLDSDSIRQLRGQGF
jgi:hypothetical protein